jgi:two-component system chemotaxis response regulator CheB
VKRPAEPLQLLVVDDSAVVRQACELLLRGRGVHVVTAADPIIAIEKMRARRPDVVLLDLNMPRMDGLSFLRRIMASDPLPVVVWSELSRADAALDALAAGAVEVIAKPSVGVGQYLHEYSDRLWARIQAAVQTPVGRAPQPRRDARPVNGAGVPLDRVARASVLALGASVGGTEALTRVLRELPPRSPPVLIVQHMPEGFTGAFAHRLNQQTLLRVQEARDGEGLERGRALVAPGNCHLSIESRAGQLVARVADAPPISGHKPSVDVLFESVAHACGNRAIGVVLTGMGSDGAAGLLAMRRAGAWTVAQDESSCVVFGMPQQAIACGAVEHVLTPDELARALHTAFRREDAGQTPDWAPGG